MEGIAHNPPALKTRMGFKLLRSNSEAIARRARRGFNLIEAAIVLGVVGLVLGGIWIAAVAMYENYKVSKTEMDVLSIVMKCQEKLAGFSFGSSDLIWSEAAHNMKIFPEDWTFQQSLFSDWGGFHTPYGGTSFISKFPKSELSLRGVSESVCVRLLRKLTTAFARDKNLGFVDLLVLGESTWAWVGEGHENPVPYDGAACDGNDNRIDMYFNFGR